MKEEKLSGGYLSKSLLFEKQNFFLSSLYFSTAELFPGGIQELLTLQQHKFLTLRLGSAGYNLL